MADLQQIVEQLSQLTVMEAAELSRMLEDKWGVSAAAPAIAVVPDIAPVTPVAEEQTEFSILLVGINPPDKKIGVIKEIRTFTGLGLKEAKDFTEKAGPGHVIKDGLSKTEVDAIRAKLTEAGAVVEIQ